jgi:hypothetical protein
MVVIEKGCGCPAVDYPALAIIDIPTERINLHPDEVVIAGGAMQGLKEQKFQRKIHTVLCIWCATVRRLSGLRASQER